MFFSGINFPKITLHVFVCDSEDYMENLQKNVFRVNFAKISDWSVFPFLDKRKKRKVL